MLGRLLLPLVFAAIPAVAQSVIPVEPERVDEFIDVLAGHDCRMSQDASEALLSAAGFPDRQEVKGIVSRLFYYDRARIQDDHLTVYFGPCPEGPETGVKTLFLQSVSANGCQMSASDSMDIYRSVGIEAGEVKLMLPLLINDGTLSLLDDEKVIIMTDEACNDYSASPEQVEDLPNEPQTGQTEQEVQALIAVVRNNGCKMTIQEADAMGHELGMEFSRMKEIAGELLEKGLVRASEDTETLILGETLCSTGVAPEDASLRTAFVEHMVSIGCSLTFADAQSKLPAAGFDMREIENLVIEMIEDGSAEVTGHDELLTIKTEDCA